MFISPPIFPRIPPPSLVSARSESDLEALSCEDIAELNAMTLMDANQTLPIDLLWRYFQLRSTPNRSCHSPFRDDTNPSFSVYMGDDGKSRFKDHGDPDVHGDSYDFFQRCTGMSPNEASLPFRELALKVKKGKIRALETIMGGAVKRGAPRPPLDQGQRAEMKEIAHLLATKPMLQQRLADMRGWQPGTILALAREGSLGWSGNSLAFIYQDGVKLRRVGSQLERKIFWKFGNGIIPWRMQLMAAARRVYLTEGETDAITAIDAGFEADPGTGVIAVPSASCLCPGSERLFEGKEIVLCLDADKSGQEATVKLAESLKPFASNIIYVNLSEALK